MALPEFQALFPSATYICGPGSPQRPSLRIKRPDVRMDLELPTEQPDAERPPPPPLSGRLLQAELVQRYR
eukprot:COSAG04_NODE_289_length_17842_cov_141.473483_11_plen_70_part_00